MSGTFATYKSSRNALDALPMWGIPWLAADNWRFWEARDLSGNLRRQFSPGALATDAALAILLLAGLVILLEYRRRRRAGILSFRLSDLFVTLTVACCILGWCAHAKSAFQREVVVQAALDGENDSSVFEEVCVAPAWARALIGDRWMPAFMWRAGELSTSADISRLDALCDDMRGLPYLSKLVLSGFVLNGDHYPYAVLKSFRQLDTLHIGTIPRLDDRDIEELAQLSDLKKLVLSEVGVDATRIERLKAALPGCTIVDDETDL